MDHSFHRQESDVRQESGVFRQSPGFMRILPLMRRSVERLANFVKLSKEEQVDAGVYLNRLGDE